MYILNSDIAMRLRITNARISVVMVVDESATIAAFLDFFASA